MILLAASACGPQGGSAPDYLGAETTLLDDGLVNLTARMRGGTAAAAAGYARCVAAGYALERGYGFARHVRTSTGREAGVRRADAVYTLSPALPPGARTLDAEVVVADCRARGIPTD